MKLVVFGLTVSSSWGNGHASVWRVLVPALAARGHDVTFFESDRPNFAAHRDLPELPGGRLVLYRAWDDVRPHAARELAEADAGIVTSFCGDALAAAELLGESNALRVFYDLDPGVTLDPLQLGRVNHLGFSGLADYDLVLSSAGGSALDELQTHRGARRVAPFYPSVDPAVHRPVTPHGRFFADLSFLGDYTADQLEMLEKILVQSARLARYRRFLIGGAHYPAELPWPPNVVILPDVPPDRHAAFFSSSRLTLNLTRPGRKLWGHCPTARLFEAAACGAPIASEWWDGLEQFFAPQTEIHVARSAEDVTRLLELSDAELVLTGRHARARVLAEHTADHRAAELERLLERARDEVAPDFGRANAATNPALASHEPFPTSAEPLDRTG